MGSTSATHEYKRDGIKHTCLKPSQVLRESNASNEAEQHRPPKRQPKNISLSSDRMRLGDGHDTKYTQVSRFSRVHVTDSRARPATDKRNYNSHSVYTACFTPSKTTPNFDPNDCSVMTPLVCVFCIHDNIISKSWERNVFFGDTWWPLRCFRIGWSLRSSLLALRYFSRRDRVTVNGVVRDCSRSFLAWYCRSLVCLLAFDCFSRWWLPERCRGYCRLLETLLSRSAGSPVLIVARALCEALFPCVLGMLRENMNH